MSAKKSSKLRCVHGCKQVFKTPGALSRHYAKIHLKKSKQPPMLDLLLQALSALHGGTNRLWPGVTVAWLADKQKFYASVCTYGGMNPAQKTVTHKATGDTALEALIALCRIWHDSTINPLVNFQRGLGIEKKGKVVPFR